MNASETRTGPLASRAPGDPQCSVVLLNYNGSRFAGLWESFFLEGCADKELLFVDNGSSDGSAEAFEALLRRYPNVRARVLRLPENVGYSQGCNAGAKEARGEYLALVNNDIEVGRSWLAPVLAAFDGDPRLGIAQSTLFDLVHRDRADRVWNRLDAWGFAHPAEPTPGAVSSVFYAEGAALVIRRGLLEELGELYPPEFYLLGEDSDLCWRARLRGWEVGVVRGSVAWHARGGTEAGAVTKLNPRVLRAVTRNRLTMLYTNYGAARRTIFLPGSAALAVVRALLLEARHDPEHARAVLAGLATLLRDRPRLRERRRRVQATRRVPDPEIARLMMDPFEGLRALWALWRETGETGSGAPGPLPGARSAGP